MEHNDKKHYKAQKGIETLRALYHFVSMLALVTIFNTFIRTHLYGSDISYNQRTNASFSDKIESVQ